MNAVAPLVEFDEPSHTYRLNGGIVPSVTTILAPLADFSRVPPEVLEYKRSLGKAVHRAIELWEQEELDLNELDPDAMPYFKGWLQFKNDSGFRVMRSEMIVWSLKHRFAGTLDLLGSRTGAEPDELLDIKCVWKVEPTTAIQTAAYQHALLESHQIKVKRRGALQLTEGSYRFFPYQDKGDFNVFQSLLNVATWQRNHQK